VSKAIVYEAFLQYSKDNAKEKEKVIRLEKQLLGCGVAPVTLEVMCTTATADVQASKPVPGRTKSYESNKTAYGLLSSLMHFLGGPAQLAVFFVGILRRNTYSAGSKAKPNFFQTGIVSQILDDAKLKRLFQKELDLREKPKISRFRFACANGGITTRGMDLLRFAMGGKCPGHATLTKDTKAFLQTVSEDFLPNGPVISCSTTPLDQKAQELAADTETKQIREEDLRAEAELESEAEVEQALSSNTVPFATQAMQLLLQMYPDISEVERLDKLQGRGNQKVWSGSQAFVGCAVAYVSVWYNDRLLGFAKLLVTKAEIFVDEILIATDMRGKRLAHHLIQLAFDTYPGRRVRLHVQVINAPALGVYEGRSRAAWRGLGLAERAEKMPPLGGLRMLRWSAPKTGPFSKEEAGEGFVFLSTSANNIRAIVEKVTEVNPIDGDFTCQIEKLDNSKEDDDEELDDDDNDESIGGPGDFTNSAENASDTAGDEHTATAAKAHWGVTCLSDALQMLLLGKRHRSLFINTNIILIS